MTGRRRLGSVFRLYGRPQLSDDGKKRVGK